MFSSVDTIWVLLGAVLVFFMQAGFAMVETGFTRSKNAGNIIMKNLMDFCIGTPAFWIVGFGLMFAAGNGFIGSLAPFLAGYDAGLSVPTAAFLIFQTVFCATAATIVSGAMAERTKFSAYCIYSGIISALVYPVSGHWIWGGGWLSELGFHDFAGSTAVHMVGGVAALVGAVMLGARIGKYDAEGKAKAIPGHSLTLGALGVFILWFAWFGFNGCSTLSMTGDEALAAASDIFVATNLAAALSTCTVMCLTWLRYGKPDISMTLNGSLAGLVAITAGCDAVSPVGAAAIGIIAGFTVVFSIEFIDKVCKVDDPVGAIGVHGVCGALGTILTGLFACKLVDDNGVPLGLFYGGGFSFTVTQIIGVTAVIIWVVAAMTAVFFIIRSTVGLRVSAEEEIFGLDKTEHGLESCYADFMPAIDALTVPVGYVSNNGEVPLSAAVPVELKEGAEEVFSNAGGQKISKVVIVTRQSSFEALKSAMNAIGVTGMTVVQVLGCGMQKGAPVYYRGVPMEMHLLPKVKVEIVICKVPVRDVIEAAKKAVYTGHIGDGKIFVYNVENAVKVRTGEEGYDALQDEE
ncbi:ammonium transporter [Cloacibacillus evryensis]|uniref:ammonium transporter n=1 Tax=Cloacibacillus evryensis TaxID=508460 RepID=UPI0026E099BA|nr:ammonium transporter [Cloacibacillus evryensis]